MPVGVRKAGINKNIANAADRRKTLDKEIQAEVDAISERQRQLELKRKELAKVDDELADLHRQLA